MNQRDSKFKWLALTGWILLCFSASAVGAFFSPGEWYQEMEKPAWNPPGWIFGPVWTSLYLMMAIAAWRVWQNGGFTQQGPSLKLFLIHLVVNASWSPIFFGLKRPDFAFGIILILWILIVATVRSFSRVDKTSSILLIPYLLWVSFASFLNFTLWRLNL